MNRTLDLASALEGSTRQGGEADPNGCHFRSVLTIAFQFTFDNHTRDNVASMARQYVRDIVGSIQRVALAIAPRPDSSISPISAPTSPEALTLVRWISRSYRY